jgi:hypothetical protein
MKNSIVRAILLSIFWSLIFSVAVTTASAGTVQAGAYETAIQRGTLTEANKGYQRGHTSNIILEEDYHDWERPIVYGGDSGDMEKAEFAAFEEVSSVPWELGVVD